MTKATGSTLHLVFSEQGFAACCANRAAAEPLVLIGDGVYAAVTAPAATAPLLAIDADLLLRGIAQAQLPENVSSVDWPGLVALVCAHGPTVSWH